MLGTRNPNSNGANATGGDWSNSVWPQKTHFTEFILLTFRTFAPETNQPTDIYGFSY